MGPFRGSRAVRSGLLSKKQLRTSSWRRMFADVYVHESVELTHLVRCRAVALILTRGAAISGASAAYLYGANVLRPEAPVEITVRRELRIPLHPCLLVRYSELRGGDVVVWNGIPVTSPVRTAFDLARRCRLEEAVAAVDALLQVCDLTVDEIVAYANEDRLRWHGVRRLDTVLTHASRGAESPMESRLRLTLLGAGLPEPVLQHSVHDESGNHVARLDLAYIEPRLGIEYDGEHHWTSEAIQKDLRRQNALRALGWTLLRFTADDVLRNPSLVTSQVRSALKHST
jgi:REase_MTES_1575